jgi:hydrophobe/amphiphile efflux-1 (HAE1) family protein
MTITELSIKRPILVIVVFAFLAVLGVIGYQQLRYELLPKITPPNVSILTVYPGAAPGEVENAVTKPLEDAVSSIDNIKRVSSFSYEGMSMVFIDFQLTANSATAIQDVQRRVNEIVSGFPSGVKQPTVTNFSLEELPIMRISALVTGSRLQTPREIEEFLSENVKPRLSQLAGVGRVVLLGGEEREVRVSIRSEALRSYNLSLVQVVAALKSANMDVPAGKVKAADRTYSVRVAGKLTTVEQLRETIIATVPSLHTPNVASGSVIRLKDIANVYDGSKELTNISRLNGEAAVGILVQKKNDANAVQVAQALRGELERLQQEFADYGVKFDVATDGSKFTLEAAQAVNHDLFMAILLVALVMLVFLHTLRDPLIVLVAIPTSLVVAFIGMWALGFSLNLMTLLAMSLAIGILVDDAMVVHENIHRHLAMGKPRNQAALEGRQEIGFSALSITLVDVVVFLPISLVPGLVGNILREFALVMVVSTLASLIVSFTLTPMLASRFAQHEHLTNATLMGRFGLWFETQFERLQAVYARLLGAALRHRILTALVTVVLLVGSLALPAMGLIGSEFVSGSDRSELSVLMELPQGTPLEATNEAARRVEEQFRALPDIAKVFVNVGTSSDGQGVTQDANAVEFNLALVPKEQRRAGPQAAERLTSDIKSIVQAVPGAKVRVAPIGLLGMANEAPIIVVFSGADRDSVMETARKAVDVVRGVKGAEGVRLSIQTGRPETRVNIDHEKMANYGLALDVVGAALRVALTGDDETKLRMKSPFGGTKEIPVRMMLDEQTRTNTDNIATLTFQNPQGNVIELRQFATVQHAAAAGKLERRNRNNSVMLYAQVLGRGVGDAGEDIKRAFAKAQEQAQFAKGVRISYEGDLELQDDSFNKLGLAFVAAIVFVYLIMVALYNSWMYPLVVLFSVPVSIVGALVALALTGQTLNIFSILGIIMLVGLVTKNAILLVDRANQMRSEARLNVTDALLEAGRTRLRPILMSTIAMVAGMMPIALAGGAGAEWKNGLAWVLVGGLTSSMVLTLVLVPTVYVDVERLRSATLRLITRLQQRFSNTAVQNAEQMEHQEHEEHQAPATASAPPQPHNGIAEHVLPMVLWAVLAGSVMISGSAKGFAQLSSAQFSDQSSAKSSVNSIVPNSLSLSEALHLGLERNLHVRIAALEQDKASQRVREVNSALLPTLTASAQYTRNLQVPVFFFPDISLNPTTGEFVFGAVRPIPAGAKNAYTASVTAQMPVYQADLYAQLKASQMGEHVSEAAWNTARQTLRNDVCKAYYNVLILQEQQKLVQQSFDRALSALAESRSLLEKGLLSEADTLRVYVQAENVRPTLMKLRNDAETAQAVLKTLIGLSGSEPITLTDSLTGLFRSVLASVPPPIAAAQEQAFAARPELKQLFMQADVNTAQVEAERAAYLPSLSAIGQWQAFSQDDSFEFSRYRWASASFVGVQFNVPIFNGFRTDARLQQALIQQMQLTAQAEQTKRQIAMEVRVALASMLDAERRIAAQSRTVQAAERSYAQTRSRWKQGLAKQLEVADADLSLNQAKTNYVQAVYEYLIAKAEFDRATGAAL